MTLSDLEWSFHALHAISAVAEILVILAEMNKYNVALDNIGLHSNNRSTR